MIKIKKKNQPGTPLKTEGLPSEILDRVRAMDPQKAKSYLKGYASVNPNSTNSRAARALLESL